MIARLEVHDLAGGYPGVHVFSGVSFAVDAGNVLTILGANGSGKSALLQTLQGVLRHRTGAIVLAGRPVQQLAAEARAAAGMALVSDQRWLWPDVSVREHLRLGAFRRSVRPGRRSRALELYQLFPGLPARRRARPPRLSGGLQQQLVLARLGMSIPRVWLLDDPLQGLDDLIKPRVLDWIRNAAAGGAAIVVAGQHIRALLELATQAMFLQRGRLARLPAGVDGLRDPRISELL